MTIEIIKNLNPKSHMEADQLACLFQPSGVPRVEVLSKFVSTESHLTLGKRLCSSKSTTIVQEEPPNGRIFDKKPTKVLLEGGKSYSWCVCGLSKKQPFCDGSHKAYNESVNGDISKPQFRSHRFQVDQMKEYFLCNCKQTNKRPFCDGTHKMKYIQDFVV